MDGSEHVCPRCGQTVETVLGRHKTLGVWVPVWGPGPCRNSECEAHVPESGARDRERDGARERERPAAGES